MSSFNSNKRCGIVLAGGRGMRVRPFIHRLKGTTLPKQYVNFIGRRSLLEHTFDRAERLISRERLFTVVACDHLNYREAQRQLAARPDGTVVVQPEDRDSGPGILLPLLHLAKRHPGAVVAVLPSDHFILEEDVFMAHVGMAFCLVESDPSRLVVLGMDPGSPEPEYDYILPDGEARGPAACGARGVRLLTEDLAPPTARELIGRGGLWDTTTLVFKAETVLSLAHAFVPRLYALLQEVQKAIGTRKERQAIEEAYRRMKPMAFVAGILKPLVRLGSSQLSVLPVSEVFWSDWNSERGVVAALGQAGYLDRLRVAADDGISAAY